MFVVTEAKYKVNISTLLLEIILFNVFPTGPEKSIDRLSIYILTFVVFLAL